MRNEYNPWLTGAVLLGILFLLYAFVRSDWGFRIMQGTWRKPDAGHPEPMIWGSRAVGRRGPPTATREPTDRSPRSGCRPPDTLSALAYRTAGQIG